jgi:hypothetical protein
MFSFLYKKGLQKSVGARSTATCACGQTGSVYVATKTVSRNKFWTDTD